MSITPQDVAPGYRYVIVNPYNGSVTYCFNLNSAVYLATQAGHDVYDRDTGKCEWSAPVKQKLTKRIQGVRCTPEQLEIFKAIEGAKWLRNELDRIAKTLKANK